MMAVTPAKAGPHLVPYPRITTDVLVAHPGDGPPLSRG